MEKSMGMGNTHTSRTFFMMETGTKTTKKGKEYLNLNKVNMLESGDKIKNMVKAF